MLVYRVFPFLDSAAAESPGHPLYEHRPQRGGRVDHPDYYVWYVGRRPEVAVGETFGNLAVWSASMFDFPALPGSRRALAVLRLPDDLRVHDLDDARALAERGLRPTQVVACNLAMTMRWGHDIWDERDPRDRGSRLWQAVQWWSYHEPAWPVLASWERPELVEVEALDLGHVAVLEAARTLRRPLP